MIDIHSHILPGIDDGPENLESSLNMARMAVADGTRAMVATPHTLNGLYLNKRKDVIEGVEAFNARLENESIALKVLPGSDVALSPELISAFDSGEVASINDNKTYLLAELPPHFIPENIYKIIFELRTRGITPVITHPEREESIIKKPEILVNLVERGCLSQLTAASISGVFGKRIKGFARHLLKHRLAHIIASDCHSPDGRPPGLTMAVKEAAKLIGKDFATKMVNDFPLAVVEGRGIDLPRYIPFRKRRKFFFWKSS